MTTRNKRKLAALNQENCEKHPRSNLAQNSSAPSSQEEYITQVSEEIEQKVTKRLSKEFSRTENRILGALARLDDFLMNPLLPGYSGATPEPTRSALGNNQGTNEGDSQNDPHPEAGLFHGQSTRNAGPEEDHDMVTGVNEQTRNDHDMVTGATERHDMVTGVNEQTRNDHDMVTGVNEQTRNDHDMVTGATERHDMVTGATQQNRNCHDMVTGATEQIGNCHEMTGVHEEVTYCPPSSSSGKQKKNRSTSQPQFRKENTRATIEADQILLALQQLANNNNSENFHININKISKLPKSLTTTLPTFDGKTEKVELFEDLFQTSLKIHNQLSEDDRINYFHSLIRGDALQTFKNINGPTRENLEDILAVFRRKYVKPQSMATAKHKFQKLVFDSANQKLVDFLDELQKQAKDAFGIAAHDIIEQFIYAKMPPHLKKSINQAHLENGTYEQIVTHLERELELNSLEYPDETQMITVTHKQQIEGNKDNAGSINSDTNDSNLNNHKIDSKSRTLYPPCETCGKTNHSTERCYVGANAANRPLPWKSKPQQQDAQDSITGCVPATAQHLN